MFEMSNDYARINTNYEVVGGCKSPLRTSGQRLKADLVHRLFPSVILLQEKGSRPLTSSSPHVRVSYRGNQGLDHG